MTFNTAKRLRGEIRVPGDKSISHRSIMLGAISDGITEVNGFLDSADCVSTIRCFRAMGVDIEKNNDYVKITGVSRTGLKDPKNTLDVGNSGTTMRLISGILSGAGINCTLDGDASIRKRPMGRIIEPLTLMGADITSSGNGLAPLTLKKAQLHGIDYTLPVASAQVKSCVLLAGLYASAETIVREISPSRDHTERMLKGFGADINVDGKDIYLTSKNPLTGTKVSVPGDISSATYFLIAGLIHPDARILVKNVNINPTRAGILKVISDMGGKIELMDKHISGGEEVCDILVSSSNLHGTTIEGDIIPTLIDELPAIAVMAAYATGETLIKDASELKKKESDRIATVTENLLALGADITPTDDGMIIRGGKALNGGKIKTYDDHRIAMSFYLPSLMIPGISFDNPGCVNISFTNFYELMESIKEQ